MPDAIKRFSPVYRPAPWILLCILALLAWISMLPAMLNMQSMWPMLGTMGMSLVSFLQFWIIMIVAMMFPALAPVFSRRYVSLQAYISNKSFIWYMLVLFLAGYVCTWALVGIMMFVLASLFVLLLSFHVLLGEVCAVLLLFAIGLYQISPLERHFLFHCNPLFCHHADQVDGSLFRQFVSGMLHGIHCLGCCGPLMAVMILVGLMNLPWMLLLTVLICCEKIWVHGRQLSIWIGIAFILFAVLVFLDPALLPGA